MIVCMSILYGVITLNKHSM